MELQLRPSAPRFHPLMRPMYRRAGFAGLGADPSINPTTIWTPQTGFLNQPGTLTQGYQFQPQVTSVYDVPGLLLPYQTCIDAQGQTAGSGVEACVNQNLATQQENFARTAAYNAGTLKLPGSTPATTPATTPAVTPSLKFTNLTSGNAAVLKIGDRWQIVITGAARNAPVSVTGGQNGAHDTTPMGSTDSAGNWTSNGQITADQIGSWTEAWTVGGQPVGTFSFTVPGGTSASSTSPETGQTVTGSWMSKTVNIGGASIPDWALIGAGLVVVFLMMRK